jgi:CubicO group peptidase (beta-lactamase class C family)
MNEEITTFVERELASRRIPGAALAVIRPGQPAWLKGFATANIETDKPFTPQTPFSIQSITKTFVGTAIMQLAEEGRLSVDDPVSKHLPGVMRNQWEAENPVLVRHLLTHTSGLPVDTAGGPPGGPRNLEEFVLLVAQTARPPEEAMVYANWGYDVAGLLIEKLTGETWYGYIQQHICAPLGMSATTAYPAPESAAFGHYLSAVDDELHRLDRAQWPIDPSDPAGGLISTVDDLALFAVAHLAHDTSLMSRESFHHMHTVAAPQWGGGGMALGFRATRSNRRRLLCHGGDGSGFTNFLGLYPDEGIALILTLNRGGVAAARSVIANTVLDMAADNAPNARLRSSSPRAVPPDGLYSSSFWAIELAVETGDGALTARPVSGLVITDGPEPSRLDPTSDDAFSAEGGMLHGFEVTVTEDGALHGGLYPFTFTRIGDLPTPDEEPVDEDADVVGSWKGSATTPMGTLAISLEVKSPLEVWVSTPFRAEVALGDCEALPGRVSGQFSITVPTVGDMTMYPRLRVRGGKLKGPLYARGWFGELAMPAELEKA